MGLDLQKLQPLKKPASVSPKDDPADYTNPGKAPERVLFINLLFFKYGTNDKTHGAAVILSILLLFFMALVYFFGAGRCEDLLTWLGSAFLFIAGVAVGKGNGKEV